MIQQALNRHSMIAIPPETKYFSSFLGHSHNCQLRRVARIQEDLQITVPLPCKRICDKASARHFYDQIAKAYLCLLRKPNAVYFGEKTPAHAGYLPSINKVFPDAKYLWIYRDGRNVALSLQKVPWMSNELSVNFLVWLFYYSKQMSAAHNRSIDILFLKYEDVVSQPVQTFSRIATFLDLPFELAVPTGSGNRQGVLDWEYSWKGLAFEHITATRVGMWKSELAPCEVEFLEYLGGHALRSLGYHTASTTPSLRVLLNYRRLFFGLTRLFWRLPLDEVANQLFGRAFCIG